MIDIMRVIIMAEYSKEYSIMIGNGHYDFSYKKILKELGNDQYVAGTCERFGTFGVHKKNDIYYLVIANEGELAEYSLFLKAFKDHLDNNSKPN